MNNTTYEVVRNPYQPKGWGSGGPRAWAIRNTITGEIVEAGFFSRAMAQEYIWREYTPAT